MIMHASEIPDGNGWQKVIAREAIKALGPQDYCGIIHWSGTEQWLWGHGLLMVGGNRDAMLARLDRMTPGDMPQFDPSMALAEQGFRKLPDAAVKHLIIISDGDPSDPSFRTMSALKAMNVTVSTVAVAAHGPAESGRLSSIAQATGGKYWKVNDPRALPRIFQREARRVARPLVWDKHPVRPLVKMPFHEILSGIDGPLPAIKGYVLTTKKEGSPLVETLLTSPEPAGEENNTVLAGWTYGLGKAVAFTSDAGCRWTSDWTAEPIYDKFFGQMIRWSMRPVGGSGKFTVATDIADGQVRVVVNALDKNDEFLNFLSMNATAVGPDMKPIPLRIEQTSPGRYVGSFPARDAGSYFLTLNPGTGQAPLRRRDGAVFRRVPRARAERRAHAATRRDRAQGGAGRQGDRPARRFQEERSAAEGRSLPPRPAQGHEQPGRLALFSAGGLLHLVCRRVLPPRTRAFRLDSAAGGPGAGLGLAAAAEGGRPRVHAAFAEPQGRGFRPHRSTASRHPLRAAAGNAAGRHAAGRRRQAARRAEKVPFHRPIVGRFGETASGELYGAIVEGEEEGLGREGEEIASAKQKTGSSLTNQNDHITEGFHMSIAETMERRAREFVDRYTAVREQIGRVIVGHDDIVHGVLTCLFVGGHCLLEGVPGLGKTLLVRTLAKTLSLEFNRIQFTPDLMPADILGTNMVMETDDGKRFFEFQRGPIFTQICLADEINRATPKTQSAMLETMQEGSVTVAGKRYQLVQPFFVMATQNPIEQEGTYPLPEAQLDRFFFKLMVGYSDRAELASIVERTTRGEMIEPVKVMDGPEILRWQELVREVILADHVRDYIVRLTLATHPQGPFAAAITNQYIRWGVSPRAAQAMALASKVRALLDGRYNVSFEDVRRVYLPALRHRILLNFEAQAEGIEPDRVLLELLEKVPEKAE